MVLLQMIFGPLQFELFRFEFHSLSSKILKIPEFNLRITIDEKSKNTWAQYRDLNILEDFPNSQVWDDIIEVTSKTVICHENDPKWRQSILNNEPELFSFRHILDEEQGSDYRILMLIRRQLSFKIIRINPESVRGLWAAQQEELIFIRNQNTERKSLERANLGRI